MSCKAEITGLKELGLYINKDVQYTRPDTSKINEINLIAHAKGSVIIDRDENPQWKREILNSNNFTVSYIDTFIFWLHGQNENIQEIINTIVNNRYGYIIEAVQVSGESFVFPSPVFVSSNIEKDVNSRTYKIELSYRTPTFENYFNKLNTLLMTNSYIITGSNTLLGGGNNTAVTGN